MKKWQVILVGIIACVWTSPVAAQVVDTVCTGAQGEVYATSYTPGSLYYWSVDGGTIATRTTEATIHVNWGDNPGLYPVKVVEETVHGCRGDTVTAWVLVQGPDSWIPPGPLCEGDTAFLNDPQILWYRWNENGSGQSSLAGSYTVARVNSCSSDTQMVTVPVRRNPVADFSINPDQPLVLEQVEFNYTGTPATSYLWWMDPPGRYDTVPNPTFTYHSSGRKFITLVVSDQYGCSDSVRKSIMVEEDATIYIPTAFSPNGDGHNDYFRVEGTNIVWVEMIINNRWGETLASLKGSNPEWNGTGKDGKLLPEAAYVYMVMARTASGREYYLKGSVTLIR